MFVLVSAYLQCQFSRRPGYLTVSSATVLLYIMTIFFIMSAIRTSNPGNEASALLYGITGCSISAFLMLKCLLHQ